MDFLLDACPAAVEASPSLFVDDSLDSLFGCGSHWLPSQYGPVYQSIKTKIIFLELGHGH